jgi:hypothetical protein
MIMENDLEIGPTNPLASTTPVASVDETESTSTSTADSWSKDMEDILEDIRFNSEALAKHHKESYISLQSQLVVFRVPLIVISALNSVFSVGLNAYLVQSTVSTINCLLSLICACISSVELFLQIQKKLELELTSYHGYYLLGAKISACIKLNPAHRDVEGMIFLNNIVNEYSNLFENSCVISKNIDDQLIKKIDPKKKKHALTGPSQLPKQWSIGGKQP